MNYWHDPGLIGYTSFATPVVTGAGALFKQAVSSIAWDASLARVNMLLMGDGWSKATNARRTTLMDTRSGAGRLHVQAPGMSSLGGNWGWFSTRQSLTHHQLYSKTVKIGGGTSIPAGTTQLKVAVTFTNQNFSDSDDIDISIVDTCPPGGGVVTVASDTSYDVRSRISLRQSETALVGRCLRLDVYAYTAVSTASVDIAYYYHSGNPDLHLRAA